MVNARNINLISRRMVDYFKVKMILETTKSVSHNINQDKNDSIIVKDVKSHVFST